MEVVMASLRLTIRLKTYDESEAWRMAASDPGTGTLLTYLVYILTQF